MCWLKACPRCQGDLVDMRGCYVACLQCGHHLSAESEMQLRLYGLVNPPLIEQLRVTDKAAEKARAAA